ncbi:hypothetical protein PRZ48_002606 [Zasmidium cellare]|uniref:Protein SDA1 n=1 Tax=Zasmidium cellare TaxID=395010 RepID=A0ABR0EU58_ZASCE|nr:hypothetical protein PRZ48_002606 [Zasmidium cellare]
MAIKQRKAPAGKPKPVIEEVSSSEDEQLEQDYHTEASDDEDEANELEDAPEEFHTDSEDASDASPPPQNDTPLLPTALLKSKPSAPTARIDWESMSQKEKKALRDELGVSMKELRNEAQKNGVLDAGKMAQLKRGIRPAERVAGGRVAKRKKRKTGKQDKPEMSGRQKLIEQRSRETRKSGVRGGDQKVVKKRKG